MKKRFSEKFVVSFIVICISVLGFCHPGLAAEPEVPVAAKNDNIIIVGPNITADLSLNTVLPGLRANYERRIKGGFYVGASLSYMIGLGRLGSDPRLMQNIANLHAMAHYHLRLGSRSYFNIGVGAGAEYHMPKGDDRNKKSKVFPCLNFETSFVFLLKNNWVFRIFPILLPVARFSYSPMSADKAAWNSWQLELFHFAWGKTF